jgi:hypothetical protein
MNFENDAIIHLWKYNEFENYIENQEIEELKNIFESSELDQNSVISILETTAGDGKKYS